MAEPLSAALARVRGAVLDDEHLVRALATGRRRGQPRATVAPRRAEVRRPQGRPAAPGHGVRRHPGVRHQPRGAAAARSTSCSTSRSPTGTSRPPRTPTSCGSPRRARRCALQPSAPSRWPRARPRPGQGAPAPRGPPGAARPRHLRRPGPGQAVAAGASTARSRSSCGRSRPPSRTRPRTGKLRTPTADDPLRVVDLGCGNAYLTFAAHAWLRVRMPVRLVGVDVKEQSDGTTPRSPSRSASRAS